MTTRTTTNTNTKTKTKIPNKNTNTKTMTKTITTTNKLTPNQTSQIQELRLAGLSYSKIARKVGCSISNVQYHVNKNKPKTLRTMAKKATIKTKAKSKTAHKHNNNYTSKTGPMTNKTNIIPTPKAWQISDLELNNGGTSTLWTKEVIPQDFITPMLMLEFTFWLNSNGYKIVKV